MLSRIRFTFGANPGAPPLDLNTGPLTVFVGPNNSGKSLALVEIEQTIRGSQDPRLIVAEMEGKPLSLTDVTDLLHSRRVEGVTAEGHVRVARLDPIDGLQDQRGVRPVDVHAALGHWHVYAGLASLFTVRLDGRRRLNLVEPRAAGDLLGPAQNHLHALFQDDARRIRLREIVHGAFGRYLVVDPTHTGQLRLRLSSRPPVDNAEEQAWDGRARAFHAAATPIADFSDGVRAFTGLVAAVLAIDFRVMLIDEPDAFLHPPLAARLGETLARLAADRDCNLFASTHSASFVMGAIQAGVPVNIVRLTYEAGVPSARLLAAAEVQRMMRDPLMRSTGVLEALFHRGAVVTEADQDRAFYQEVNARLLNAGERAADGVRFLNAQNKQTVRRIMRPLREMGVPAAAVVDLDFVKDTDSRNTLHDAFVPQALIDALGTLRGQIDAAFRAKQIEPAAGGLGALDRADKDAAENWLNSLADYGIFLVPVGELEKWLGHLGITGNKSVWLPRTFSRMGDDPSDGTYVRPAQDDVWAFVRRIGGWIHNPARRGMPD